MSFHGVQKMRNAGSEFKRDLVGGWFPVQMDEELFGIILLFTVGENKLSVNIAAEALRALLEFFRPGRILWLEAEVKSEAE